MTLRDASVLVPLALVIVGAALYPSLILKRGEASVQDKVGAVSAAVDSPSEEVAAKP